MTADEILAAHQRMHSAYASQLAELSHDHPDLDRCSRIANDIDSELSTLPPLGDLSGLDGDTRTALLDAARISAELLGRNRAALLAQRERLLEQRSRAERADEALRAYLPPETVPDARFLDERH